MMQRKSTFLIALTIASIILLAGASSAEIIQRYDPSQNLQDLLLIGFSEVTFHAMDVRGNVQAFEAANSWLNEDFAANYRFSLLANGNLGKYLFLNGTTILDSRVEDEYRTHDPSVFRLRLSLESTEPLWDGWRFTGTGVYDPERMWELGNLDTRLLTQPQEKSKLEVYARLESDEHGYIEGGSLHPGFKDSQFSLNRRSLFGLFADVEQGAVGAEVVAGKLEGKAYREGGVIGIRANGTSGPYYLSNAPMTRGSEVVKIEVRDRFDETTVMSSRTLTRDIDYEADYLRGRILLYQPVASETLASDPVFIVITYDYQRAADDDLIGTRLRVMPGDSAHAAVSFLHRNSDIDAFGAGEDEPDNLQSADVAFTISDFGRAYAEVAGSDNPGDDGTYLALRAGFDGMPTEHLRVSTEFQKLEDDFRSFTNSDLNATKNQQRFKLDGTYDLTESQQVMASFRNLRGLAANGQFNSYPGHSNENIFAAGYRNRFSEGLRFGLSVEQRDRHNRDDKAAEDNQQRRYIGDIDGSHDNTGFLGRIGYGAHYEYITFRDATVAGSDDTNRHQMAVKLSSAPSTRGSVEVTQKMNLTDNVDLDQYESREDATFLTVRIRPHSTVNTLGTMEYKRFTMPGSGLTLWQDDPNRIDRAGTFALEYIPFKKIKTLGKIGRYDSESWSTDSTTRRTDDFILGQVTYFPRHHLSISGDTEYRRLYRIGTGTEEDRVWDLGLRLNWNRDRLTDFTVGVIRHWHRNDMPALAEITSTSYLLLVSGSVPLGHNFFARASIKSILLRNALTDEKTMTRIEFGYEGARWYRVSAGYERIENETDGYDDRYYRGHGLFMRLAGKF